MAVKLMYPSLPARRDLGWLRIGGWGLGNCLFVYFHAFVTARSTGRRMIAPAWRNFQIGPWLRGERSGRRYGTMIHRHPDEVGGMAKMLVLLRALAVGDWRPWRPVPAAGDPAGADPNCTVAVFDARDFTFALLHDHRAAIRDRLRAIAVTSDNVLGAGQWGEGDYAAIHVRLGDFAVATPEQVRSGKPNLRIPIAWYRDVARHLHGLMPATPIRVYSDGEESELAELLSLEGVSLHREANDIGDMLALAGARLLVGSNSTFSRWAAFLGDMPTIWCANEAPAERFGSPATPMFLIDQEMSPLDMLVGR